MVGGNGVEVPWVLWLGRLMVGGNEWQYLARRADVGSNEVGVLWFPEPGGWMVGGNGVGVSWAPWPGEQM